MNESRIPHTDEVAHTLPTKNDPLDRQADPGMVGVLATLQAELDAMYAEVDATIASVEARQRWDERKARYAGRELLRDAEQSEVSGLKARASLVAISPEERAVLQAALATLDGAAAAVRVEDRKEILQFERGWLEERAVLVAEKDALQRELAARESAGAVERASREGQAARQAGIIALRISMVSGHSVELGAALEAEIVALRLALAAQCALEDFRARKVETQSMQSKLDAVNSALVAQRPVAERDAMQAKLDVINTTLTARLSREDKAVQEAELEAFRSSLAAQVAQEEREALQAGFEARKTDFEALHSEHHRLEGQRVDPDTIEETEPLHLELDAFTRELAARGVPKEAVAVKAPVVPTAEETRPDAITPVLSTRHSGEGQTATSHPPDVAFDRVVDPGMAAPDLVAQPASEERAALHARMDVAGDVQARPDAIAPQPAGQVTGEEKSVAETGVVRAVDDSAEVDAIFAEAVDGPVHEVEPAAVTRTEAPADDATGSGALSFPRRRPPNERERAAAMANFYSISAELAAISASAKAQRKWKESKARYAEKYP